DNPGPGAYDPIYSPVNKYKRYGFIDKSNRFPDAKPEAALGAKTTARRLRSTSGTLRATATVSGSRELQRKTTVEPEAKRLRERNISLQTELDLTLRNQREIQDQLQSSQQQIKLLQHKFHDDRQRLGDEIRRARNETRVFHLVSQETESELIYQRRHLTHRVQALQKELGDVQYDMEHTHDDYNQQISQFEKTIQHLSTQLASRNDDLNQVNRLKDQIRAQAQQEKQELEAELDMFKNRLDMVRTHANDKGQELERLSQQLEEEKKRATDSEARYLRSLDDIQEELSKARKREAEARQVATECHSQIDYWSQQIKDLESEANQHDLEHRLALDRYKTQLEDRQHLVDQLSADKASLNVRLESTLETFQSQKYDWEATKKTLNRTITQLETDLDNTNTQVMRLNQQLTLEKQQHEQALDAAVDEKNRMERELKLNETRYREKIETLQREHDQAKAEWAINSNVKVQSLQRELDSTRQETNTAMHQLEVEVEGLHAALNEANDDRNAQLEALDIAREKIQALRQKNGAYQDRCSHLELEEVGWKDKWELAQNQRTQSEERSRELEQLVRQANREVERLTTQVTELEQQHKERTTADHTTLETLHGYVSELESTLQTKADEIEQLQQKTTQNRSLGDVRQYEKQVYQLEQQVLQYEQELKEVRTKAEEEYLSLQREKRRLNDTADEYKAQFETLTTLVESLRAQVFESEAAQEELANQMEHQVQFLQKNYNAAYKDMVKAQGLNAQLAGHNNLKQKIKYITQLKEENQTLKRNELILEKTRDTLRRRVMHLERDLEAYQAVGITGQQLVRSRVERAYRAQNMATQHMDGESPMGTREINQSPLPAVIPFTTPHSLRQRNKSSPQVRASPAAAKKSAPVPLSQATTTVTGIKVLAPKTPMVLATTRSPRKRPAPSSPCRTQPRNSTQFVSLDESRPIRAAKTVRGISKSLQHRIEFFDTEGTSNNKRPRLAPANGTQPPFTVLLSS
ncbi:hypothetical protein IWQ61_008703, partial [Dispira simplex]